MIEFVAAMVRARIPQKCDFAHITMFPWSSTALCLRAYRVRWDVWLFQSFQTVVKSRQGMCSKDGGRAPVSTAYI